MRPLEPIRKLGEGAVAEVHLARDPRAHACVVLEVLRRGLQDCQEVVGDFLRAGRLRRTFAHPNLALRVAEGATPDGRPFLLTEPVPSRTLRGWLRERGALEAERAAAMLAPLASAVGFLHDQGLVLNGLSSRSVFLEAPDGETARPKLFDASLSLLRRGALTQPPRSCTFLEPEYMAPERILGNRADPRSDIYALGVLFYELFAGIAPFSGSSRHAIYRAHLGSPIPRLPAQAGPYASVVERCLAKEPDERFPTTRALLEALEAGRESSVPSRSRPRGQASARASEAETPTRVMPPKRELLSALRTGSGAAERREGAPERGGSKRQRTLVLIALLSAAVVASLGLWARGGERGDADAPVPNLLPASTTPAPAPAAASVVEEPAALIVDEPAVVVRGSGEAAAMANQAQQERPGARAKKSSRAPGRGPRKLRAQDLKW